MVSQLTLVLERLVQFFEFENASRDYVFLNHADFAWCVSTDEREYRSFEYWINYSLKSYPLTWSLTVLYKQCWCNTIFSMCLSGAQRQFLQDTSVSIDICLPRQNSEIDEFTHASGKVYTIICRRVNLTCGFIFQDTKQSSIGVQIFIFRDTNFYWVKIGI